MVSPLREAVEYGEVEEMGRVPEDIMTGRVGEVAGVVEVAVVTASQKAARPGSVEHAPHVLGSPVQTGSSGEGADSVRDQSLFPPVLFDLIVRGRERGGEGGEG